MSKPLYWYPDYCAIHDRPDLHRMDLFVGSHKVASLDPRMKQLGPLLTAAPEMYEALKMAVRVIEKADTSEADFAEQGDALFKAKLAIHKAEGCCK